jgi:hypothetical protein
VAAPPAGSATGRNATTIANERSPIQPYEQVFFRPISDADQWQKVEARGSFDADHQFVGATGTTAI